MNIKNNKLKAAILASLMIININNSALAGRAAVTEYEGSFSLEINSEMNTEGGGTKTYLYYCAEDTTVENTHTGQIYDLKSGNYYILYNGYSRGGSLSSQYYHLIGSAGSMSEDELQQAIDDAIHNVDGDQTVDGNQQVTGDQTVDGEQTVNGGQSVSGGFFHKKGRANYEETI